jgi:hypothetical protein
MSAGCWVDSLNKSAFALTSYGHSCTKLLGVEKTPQQGFFHTFIFAFYSFLFFFF